MKKCKKRAKGDCYELRRRFNELEKGSRRGAEGLRVAQSTCVVVATHYEVANEWFLLFRFPLPDAASDVFPFVDVGQHLVESRHGASESLRVLCRSLLQHLVESAHGCFELLPFDFRNRLLMRPLVRAHQAYDPLAQSMIRTLLVLVIHGWQIDQRKPPKTQATGG